MYNFIDTNEWCLESIRELKVGAKYALDIETTGLDPFSDIILLIQVGDESGKVNIYDARKINQDTMKKYLDYFFDIAGEIIGTNLKFDLKFLTYNYNAVPKIGTLYDAGLMEWVLTNCDEDSNFHSLKDMIKKYLNLEIEKDIRLEFVGYDKDYFSDELLDYAAADVIHIFKIEEIQQHYLNKNGLIRIADIENNCIPATVQMELTGVQIDIVAWLDMYKINIEKGDKQLTYLQDMVSEVKCEYYTKRYDKIREYDFGVKRFNPNSSEEALAILKHRGVKLERRSFDKKTKKEIILYEDLDTTNAKVLEKVNDEFAKEITKYRKLRVLTSRYGDKFLTDINPKTGRIHCNFHQNGTNSGRLSTSGPSLQNIPIRENPEFRDCFIEDDPYLQITSDYSQVELRLAGEQSGDEKVIDAFAKGIDSHTLSGSSMYEIPVEQVTKQQRADGKKFNFSVLYGAEAYNVSVNLEIPIKQAEILVNNWRKGVPQLAEYLDSSKKYLIENGYVTTQWGRRRYWVFPSSDKKGYRGIISKFGREAANHPIQGTSADMIKIALTNIFYRIQGYDAQLIRTVHDEITVRAHKDIADGIQKIVIDEMEKAGRLFLKRIDIKVDCQTSRTWAK